MSCTPESFRRPVFLATLAVFSSLTIAILSSAVASAQATADRSRDDQPGSRQLDDQPPVADPRQRPAAVDETQSAEATIDPTRRGSEGVDQSADAGLLLTDADRVSWLAAQLEDAAELNAYAVERLSDSKVEDFAKQNSDHLKQQATVARQAAVQRSDAAWQASRAHAEDAPDLSDTIGEIGDAVRDRLRERAASDNRARPAFEGQAGNREAVDARLANRRADRDDRNLAQPNSDSSRLERRRSARERLGVLLPAVREELPEMLEMLAEAIEDESTDTAAWVDHQTKIADRILEAKKEELARYRSGERFDHDHAWQ
mgnify:CR=1 FL=1